MSSPTFGHSHFQWTCAESRVQTKFTFLVTCNHFTQCAFKLTEWFLSNNCTKYLVNISLKKFLLNV